ncbi:MAG: 2-hydroxychromene-2-carboxylate isomerase [Pseudomonadota bacterium]
MKPLVFWFEFASTYSWIAVERLASLPAGSPPVRWRPFLLGPIFKAKGWNTSPFNLDAAKGAYMWRDLGRLAAGFGLRAHRPQPFPQNGLRAARIATACSDAAWLQHFVRAVFRAQFVDGRDIADDAVIVDALHGLVPDVPAVLEAADLPATKAKLRDATTEAQGLGIFGAPSFTVGDELFWGQDRLADALAWAQR